MLDIEKRFWPKVMRADGCWNWSGTKQRYGRMKIGNRMQLAHRVSWEIHRGQVPDGLCVLHRCDNGICVNPDHLFLGTHTDNMRDRQEKHRWEPPRLVGELNPCAKLSLGKAEEMRTLYRLGMLQREIGNKFGVTQGAVSEVIHKKRWI